MPIDFTDVVVFGDSLSDVGNTALNPLVQLFGQGSIVSAVNGRFTNGQVWVEPLADKLGLPGSASTRSDAGGDNYAHGGARTGSGTQTLGTIDNLGTQVSSYVNNNTPTGSELFILWGGGNDLLDAAATPQTVRNNMSAHVSALAGDGAARFLVMNLPLLGDVPRNLGTANQATLNSQSVAYNSLLDAEMASLESTLGIDIAVFDVADAFNRLVTEPALFGFTNTTQPAFDVETETAVANPDQYVFWDEIHPTAAAHAILANAAFVALHTPGDFTGDGVVDADDLQIVLTRFAQTTTPFNLEHGDWDGNGSVGMFELDLVLANWTQQAPMILVPEPSALGVLLVGLGLSRRRRPRVSIHP